MQHPATGLMVSLVLVALAITFLLRRILASPTRDVEKCLNQIEGGEIPILPQRTDYDHDIKITETGFAILPLRNSDETTCHGEWNAIRTVTAFKADLFTADCVCLAFEFFDGRVIQAHEEMRGWLDLCRVLPIHLPGAPPWEKWFMNITTPAFEPCITVLYRSVSSSAHKPLT